MKNFGLSSLILIDPQCDHLSKEALDRASHAAPILKKAKTIKLSGLDKFDVLIGTTAKLGTDYNIPRLPLLPKELGQRLAGLSPSTKVGLLFGRESKGLSNRDIQLCDFTVTIPTSPEYPH
jgi:TrmH family RNA methyltransferase